MAKQLLGKEVTASLNERIKAQVAGLQEKGIQPTLGIIRVGENPSDLAYERGATKRCETLGVACEKIVLPEDVSQEELLKVIDDVNKNDKIHGVLLFRPLPKHLNQAVIENALDPAKDVDCMTDGSMSGVFTGKKVGFPPCTPQACMEILDYYGIECTGKKAVVIGRSLVVGKPAAMMLIKKNATVTVCHTKTVDMPSVTREADIIIVAAGRAGVVGAEYVKPGQTVITGRNTVITDRNTKAAVPKTEACSAPANALMTCRGADFASYRIPPFSVSGWMLSSCQLMSG